MDPQLKYQQEGDPRIPGKFQSLWIDTTPATHFPPLSKRLEVDVTIVGGGIVGITTAFFLKSAGLKVALIESGRIADSVTGHTTAKITSLHDLIYDYLISEFGLDAAKIHGQASQGAIEKIAEIIDKYKINCDFYRTAAYTFAEKPEENENIRKEVEAARRLSLPASYEETLPLPFEIFGSVRFGGQAQFHPRKYLLALAKMIPGNGSFIFEITRALSYKEGEPCIVETDKGNIRSRDVVMATHVPFFKEPGFFFSRLYQVHSYVLGAFIQGEIPEGMFISTGNYTIRNQPTQGGTMMILGGGDHKAGQGGDTIARYQQLVDFYSQRYKIKKIAYRWSTEDPDTPDRLPLIGKVSRSSKHVYMASGFGGWGMTNGTLAATIISDRILGKRHPAEMLYDPNRTNLKQSAGRFILENANAAKEFVSGKIFPGEEVDLKKLVPGEGGIGEIKGEEVGVYKNFKGKIFAVSPYCTFEGCKLSWNAAEKTWDCPCCGSRFNYDGTLIMGPANKDLAKKEV